MIVGRRVLRKETIPSSNELAKRYGREDEPEGLVIVAERQTEGRGRMGRGWSSPAGGLYISILLRPKVPAPQLLRMSVFSGVPVALALEKATGLKVGLKWPNDLQLGDRKVGGILMESVSVGSKVKYVVLGIGLNVNSRRADIGIPEASSLYEETGREVDIEGLLADVLERIEGFYIDFEKGVVPEDEYAARSTVLKRRIEAVVGKESFIGKALYIGNDGALVLKSDEGLVLKLSWVNETSIRTLEGDADFEKSLARGFKKDLISN
jgi:BirA family biotin operon repressor/biotin-[acetyl-CoA-carboxylase] ligase